MVDMASILDRAATGLEVVHIPDPAQGADFAWVTPEFTNILPVSISLLITTSGAPANRLVMIAGRRGGTSFCHATAPGVVTALKSIEVHFSICVLGLDAQPDNDIMTGCLSGACVLNYDEEVISIVDDLDSGDQISDITMRYLQKMPR